jgi:hypothetical protein
MTGDARLANVGRAARRERNGDGKMSEFVWLLIVLALLAALAWWGARRGKAGLRTQEEDEEPRESGFDHQMPQGFSDLAPFMAMRTSKPMPLASREMPARE